MNASRGSIISAFLALATVGYGAGDRITRPVDTGRITPIKGNVHPAAQPKFDQGPAAPSTQLDYITLLLRPNAGIEEFLASQNTPGSTNYRKWLTPEEFADRFGISQGDVGKFRTWLESQGLRVNDVARGRHWITFSGTADKVGKALHTEFHRYVVNGESHIANAAEPSVPEAFGEVVAGFRGLHDFLPTPPRRNPTADYNFIGSHYLAPADLATIYDITPLYNLGIDGTGQTIVILGGSDLMLSDLEGFQRTFGMTISDPKQVLFGKDPGINIAALGEADLDLEVAGGIAPGATLIYAYATNPFTAMQYAVDQNLGQVMNASFGACELGESSAFEAIAQQANAQGITIMASAGDAGAVTCDRFNLTPQATTGVTVSWPASFPEVTAVGGTEFNEGTGNYWATRNSVTGASALSYIPERPWNDSALLNELAAGGGGPSGLFAKPAWQTGPGVPNDGARDVPDVSLSASWAHDAYMTEYEGVLLWNGGTSASSPTFAGIVALLNQYLVSKGTLSSPGVGNINPALYRMAQAGIGAFHDVTSGDTNVPCAQSSPGCVDGLIGFSAGPGYDMATGLGSVDASILVEKWNAGAASTTTLTVSSPVAGPSNPISLTAAVTGAGKAIPTGTVSFVLGNVGTLGNVTIATATLDSSGMATVSATGMQLSIGDGTIQALYSGDGVFEGSSGAAKISITYPISITSVVVPFVTPNPVPEDGIAQWPYQVALVERAGIATTLTGFVIDGVTQNLANWSSTTLPANGMIYASLVGGGLKPPVNRLFVFSGKDASGQTWTQQVSIPFVTTSQRVVTPGISLTTATPTVSQNTQAPSTCQWAQQISLQETGGFLTLLQTMTVNGASFTPQIQQIFGTTRLAPYGLLQGTLCFGSGTQETTVVTAIFESGGFAGLLSGLATATLGAAPIAPVSFSSPAPGLNVSLAADATGNVAPVNIPVSFGGSGSAAWTVSVGPANSVTSSWLSVSPKSGTGEGSITASASAAGLSPGAYTAFLTIASASAQPATVTVPVTLVIGGSSNISIGGMVNNFSGNQTAAPGMIAAVFGSGMAPAGTALSAPGVPLPLSMGGVSATVNGVSAPLYYVSPTQVNLQIPYETGAGTAILAINNNGQIATYAFPVAVTAPGLFAGAFDNSSGKEVTTIAAGEALVLYMTGEGDVTPTLATGATPSYNTNPLNYPQPRMPVTVTIGGVSAKVLFQAVPFPLVGTTQIDVLVPSGLSAGPQQLVVTVGSVAAAPLNLSVGAAAK